ncbi:EscU/YscU/HrcU family type III secretion system export apparatus switch protein [Vibrio chagasii]|nr:EscU/YscU/HrcU family type III secretion system export apparatus switch protein [Vibrio chagasii]
MSPTQSFSVALRCKQNRIKRPLWSPNLQIMAMNREIARENGIYIVPAPPLARSALSHYKSLNNKFRDGLFAVAQVLAYVLLKQYRKRGGER